MSRLYFSFTSPGIFDRSVRIAAARAPGHSHVFALRSAGIFLATLLRMRWALATLADWRAGDRGMVFFLPVTTIGVECEDWAGRFLEVEESEID